MAGITLPEFVHKWTASQRTERAASQEHFIDLCRLLEEQTPNEASRIDVSQIQGDATADTMAAI